MLKNLLAKLQAKKSKKGFTLVELMVVVAIIGILVVVAIPVYNNVTGDAKVTACKNNQRTIDSAYQIAVTAGKTITKVEDLVPDYIAELPVCPEKGTYSLVTATAGTNTDKTKTATCSATDHALHTTSTPTPPAS